MSGRFTAIERLAWWKLVAEKLPLFCLSAFASWMQMRAVEPIPTEDLGMLVRVSNAVVSYALYLRDLALPVGLGVLYPHPQSIERILLLVAIVALASFTFLGWRERLRRPYLLIGWLWFLGNLVPMLGLVQVGDQARADRFTYISQIGIFIAVVWFARSKINPRICRILCVVWLGALAVTTARQVLLWEDSITLFDHTARVTAPNPRVLALAGFARTTAGDSAGAIRDFRESLKLRPHNAATWTNLGAALNRLDRNSEAADAFYVAASLDPEDLSNRRNLARTLAYLDRREEAITQFRRLALATPDARDIHLQLGNLLTANGEEAEGALHLQKATALLEKESKQATPPGASPAGHGTADATLK
jgi:Flp pilus assembly protein TadD